MELFTNLDAAKAAGVQIKSYSMTESRRGVAWGCTVYFKGKNLGRVSNHGAGGETFIEFSIELQKEVMNALKGEGYKLKLNIGETPIEEPETLHEWIEFSMPQIGDEINELRDLKRRAKTQTIVEQRKEPYLAAYKVADTLKTREILTRQLGSNLVAFLNDKIQSY